MITGPDFVFFIPGERGQICPDSPLWHRPLSGNSAAFSKKIQATGVVSGPELIPELARELTIGDYFTAARTFLEKGGGHLLAKTLSVMSGKAEGTDPVQTVELFLEKHGAFYHPFRVKVFSKTGRQATLVLNGAVSKPGLALIEKEYQLLASLEKRVAIAYTPRVFGVGILTLDIPNSGKKNLPGGSNSDISIDPRKVGFFLGEWFEGFREFHISTRDGASKIAVWASNGDVEYLSLERAAIIYEQIAHILTVSYTLDTGGQIFPWHHAAGDFVVDPQAQGFPVKLITVRGYASLMEFDPADSGGQILPALLFFFLNLTLRMQMDRLDGVGSLVFLGEEILRATVTGFLRGLDDMSEKKSVRDLVGSDLTGKESPGLREIFVGFMTGFSREQIQAILTNLIESWSGDASERIMAGAHLNSHAISVHSLFKIM